MYLHRRLFLWGAAAVLATLGTTRVLADEKGDALLKDVEAATKNVKTLSADLSMSEIVKAPDGKETVLKMAGTVKLKKPNLARMEFTSGPFAKTIASDGKNVYTLMPGNQYRKATVDANGRAINTFWATPLSMFFSGKFTSLVGDKAPALYVGKKIVDGMEYDVIQMKGEKPLAYTMNLYVTSAKLVTRMDMAFTQGGQTGKMNAILTNVKVNASLPDATFAYVPPKTAKLYAPPSMEDYNKNLLPVGSVAPRFALSTPTGGKVALEEVLKTKKAVLINFWVHGWGACREEFPHLQTLYTELKDKGLELVALNGTDGADVINNYVKENNFTFLVGMKGKGDNYDAALQYRVSAYPTNYLLDSSGKVIFRSVGFDEDGIRAALAKLGVK